MKKICFITTIPATLRGFVIKTAEYLHNNTDWDISFICDYDEKFAKELPEYIHYLPVPMERGMSLSGIKAIFETRKIFKREKFDLIQYSTPNASFYASVGGWLAKVPVRLYCQWGMAYIGFYGIKRKIFKFIEKTVCYFSTHIEPDSPSNLNFAHSEGLYSKNKGSVIWNGSACGLNTEKFDYSKRDDYRNSIREQYNIPNNAFVFGFVGSITRDKGINELLAAFKSLCTDYQNVYLMIVGEPDKEESLNKELIDWSKNEANIIYTGKSRVVEQNDSAMDAFVLPSYREGFGMVVIEAEAMGTPVIVTDIPGPTDAMRDGETGIVVKKKDVTSLAAAMKFLLENPQITKQYGINAAKFAREKFEQKTFFKQHLQKRKELLKEQVE